MPIFSFAISCAASTIVVVGFSAAVDLDMTSPASIFFFLGVN
jgi:hypothetical protein